MNYKLMMSSEIERLKAVERFKQLDAGLKRDLDEITNLVALICEKSIAVISLIDDNIQWFKSIVGMGEMECGDRELSFCNHTIRNDGLLIITDATQDSRFAQLPVVINEPYVRFYAGTQLKTFDGYVVGTLCVLDSKPGSLTNTQITSIKVLAKQVSNLLELNWSLQTLMHQHEQEQTKKQLIENSAAMFKAISNNSDNKNADSLH
ncbi:GAF domain-containing protein [Mucilaginibacter robiniae]|uniref:GAF domain-containing protein n=1 Tax=Mucilaginibacter robiniae TaxID=2728022 RepID=A0A7L5DU13_9SPHI|nr:GAF domain-containing protein [Mucilaginibacter robiniae]QJD94542.1 GAF domain-containing protein [Mucilaginibacter robiniae]